MRDEPCRSEIDREGNQDLMRAVGFDDFDKDLSWQNCSPLENLFIHHSKFVRGAWLPNPSPARFSARPSLDFSSSLSQ
jgi:hypothetical protein